MMIRSLVSALIILGAAPEASSQTFTPSANCSLGSAAFCETFEQGPAAIRGRGGDLDTAKWAMSRLSGEITSSGLNTANPVQIAPIPACRAGVTQTSVYPPNDMLICDPVGNQGRRLMTAVAMQNYGVNSFMARQPFDFAGRTGKIVFDVDAVDYGLGGFVEIDVTEDPTPATTFREQNNFEVGPPPRNGLTLRLSGSFDCQNSVAPLNTFVYSNYAGTIAQPTFNHANGCAQTSPGKLNHFEVRLSQSHIDVYGSDFSPDGGQTFPNFKLLYSADISLPFTRGYLHLNPRNHASAKYNVAPDIVYFWDNVGFDGPVLPVPRAYEVPDNTTSVTYDGSVNQNLGWWLAGPPRTNDAGIYSPTAKINSLSIPGVNLSGATAASMTLDLFFNDSGSANTSWGINYRLNGGALRSYTITAAEIVGVNAIPGSPLGILAIKIDIPLADLVSGANSLEMFPVNLPQNYPPVVANIDLLVAASGSPPPPPVNGACGSANGTTVATAPTTNLCAAGTASAIAGTGPWTWTCAGSNGGTTASCSANKTASPPPANNCTVTIAPFGFSSAPGQSGVSIPGTVNCQ